jgi:hypothetical protein
VNVFEARNQRIGDYRQRLSRRLDVIGRAGTGPFEDVTCLELAAQIGYLTQRTVNEVIADAQKFPILEGAYWNSRFADAQRRRLEAAAEGTDDRPQPDPDYDDRPPPDPDDIDYEERGGS